MDPWLRFAKRPDREESPLPLIPDRERFDTDLSDFVTTYNFLASTHGNEDEMTKPLASPVIESVEFRDASEICTQARLVRRASRLHARM